MHGWMLQQYQIIIYDREAMNTYYNFWYIIVKMNSHTEYELFLDISKEDDDENVTIIKLAQTQPSTSVDLQQILNAINQFISKTQTQTQLNQFNQIFIKHHQKQINIYNLVNNPLQTITYQTTTDTVHIPIILRSFKPQAFSTKQIYHFQMQIEDLKSKSGDIRKQLKSQIANVRPEQKQAYDLMYFYAEPLVSQSTIQRGQFIAENPQVSYLKEYTNFVKFFADQPAERNIKVKMRVGCENNLRKFLNEGINILHFSCHGKQNILKLQSNFQVSKGYKIGKLWELTTDVLIGILKSVQTKPKIIVFNACLSAPMAQKIYKQLGITTIGYNKQVPQNYCELLTQIFYTFSFKRQEERQTIQQLIHQIRKKMKQISQTMYEMLIINASPERMSQPLLEPSVIAEKRTSNLILDELKNTQQAQQYFGIKKQLFDIINKDLSSNDKQVKFLVGESRTGKTVLIKQAMRYLSERECIDKYRYIDLKKQNCQPVIHSTFMLDLYHKNNLDEWIKNHEGKRVMIVFDHCEELLKFDRGVFVDYVKQNFLKKITSGKIIIVADQDEELDYLKQVDLIKKRQFKVQKKAFDKLLIRNAKNKLENILKAFPELKKLIIKPQNLIKAIQNASRDALQIIQYLQQQNLKQKKLITDNMSKFIVQVAQSNVIQYLKSEINKFTKIIKTSQSYIQNFIFHGKYRQKQDNFPIVNFILVADSPPIIKELQEQNMEKFWEQTLKHQIKKLKIYVENLTLLIYENNENYKEYNRLVAHLISLFFELIHKVANFCFFLHKYAYLKQELILSFVIIERIQSKFTKQIQQNLDLSTTLRSNKIRLLLSVYCLVNSTNSELQMEQKQKSNIKRCLEFELKNSNNNQFQFDNYECNEQEIVKLALNLHSQVVRVCFEYKSFGEELNVTEDRFERGQLFSGLEDGLNTIVKYYKSVEKLQNYHKNAAKEKTMIQFVGQWQIKSLELIGLKLILIFINYLHKENNKNIKLNLIKEKIRTVGEILINSIRKRVTEYKDKSFVHLYHQYTKGYVKARFNLEILNKEGSITLNVYDELKNRCKEAKLNSYLNQIRTYMKQNLSNTCSILVSSPLGFDKYRRVEKQRDSKVEFHRLNTFRSQHSFQHKIRKVYDKIEKEIYVKINQFSEDKVQEMFSNPQLILLIYSDIKRIKLPNISNRQNCIIMQDYKNGKSLPIKLQDSTFPTAKIVISAGQNMQKLKEKFFQKNSDNKPNQSCVCFISLKKIDQQQERQQRKSKIVNHYQQIIKQRIFSTHLELFYDNFCRVLFTNRFPNLKKQILTAYEVGKLEARVNTKMQYSHFPNFLPYIDNLSEAVNKHQVFQDNQPPIKMKNGKCIIDNYCTQKNLNVDSKNSRYTDIGLNQQLIDCIERLNEIGNDIIIVKCQNNDLAYTFVRMLIQKVGKYQLFKNGIEFIDFKKRDLEEQIKQSYSRRISAIKNEDSEKKLQIFMNFEKGFISQLTKRGTQTKTRSGDRDNNSPSYAQSKIKTVLIAKADQIQRLLEHYSIDLQSLEEPDVREAFVINEIINLVQENPGQNIEKILQKDIIAKILKEQTCRETISYQIFKNHKKLLDKKKSSGSKRK